MNRSCRYHALLFTFTGTALFLTGCSTPHPLSTLEKDPSRYKRIQLAAVSVSTRAQGNFDPSTLVSLPSVASLLEQRTKEVFRDKHYDLVSSPAVRLDTNWISGDEFFRLVSSTLQANLPVYNYKDEQRKALHSPSSFADLGVTNLAGTDTDALLFIFTDSELESPSRRKKRWIWNTTGGAILTPVIYMLGAGAAAGGGGPPEGTLMMAATSWISHSAILLDAHSGELIWGSGRIYAGESLARKGSLQGSLEELLHTLPDNPH